VNSAVSLLIAPDSCILVPGIHLRLTRPYLPEVRVVTLAERGVFDVLVVENVEDEVRAALKEKGEEDEFDRFCSTAHVLKCPGPSLEQIEQYGPSFLREMHHQNDVPIAIAIMLSLTRPNIVVSTNTRHWKQNLGPLLGGVEVMSPKQLLSRLSQPSPV